MVFASRRREQGASAGGGGEQHLRARLWLAVDVRRHLLLVLVARAPLPPRSRHTKGHLPSEWMRVRMSDLDTALEGAHADVSGGTGACAGQRAAAATWCEEAARSPRPPLFLPVGGLWVPSKSAKPAPAENERSFWVWLYFLFREYHILHRTQIMAICARYQKCGESSDPSVSCAERSVHPDVNTVRPQVRPHRNGSMPI